LGERAFPRLTAAEIIAVLKKHGFQRVKTSGGHQKWRSPETHKRVIVPYHAGQTLPLETTKAIIEGSGIPLENWFA
jgi:predicted RNA binding protein YcfA (HicA-like mRNA interferase family)